MRPDKQAAILLRKSGKSYNEIASVLDVPKSTLSSWLKSIKMPADVEKNFWDKTRRKRAENITQFNKQRAEIAKQRAKKICSQASRDIGKLSERELFLIGVALYWAEGGKRSRWCLHFSNSDPLMIKLIIKFFREACGVKKNKLRAMVQTHSNIVPQKAVNYWSQVAKIPKKQFFKTYIRKIPASKKKRTFNILPYGTLRVSVLDVDITSKMNGWIAGLGKK